LAAKSKRQKPSLFASLEYHLGSFISFKKHESEYILPASDGIVKKGSGCAENVAGIWP
jgi:hypothetical protein